MTTEYTHPDVLTAAAGGASWADPETDPTRINWAARQANAVIPFQVVNGRPVNPCESTGIRYGRNELGHWGEQVCADALVTATDLGGRRQVLMVERGDGHGWALPGGYVEPGEDPADAGVRELSEETGILLPDGIAAYEVDPARYVPDPRASDEAWMVTVVTRINLGTVTELPPVTGTDDVEHAAWITADSYEVLLAHLATRGGVVFPAHRAILRELLTPATTGGAR